MTILHSSTFMMPELVVQVNGIVGGMEGDMSAVCRGGSVTSGLIWFCSRRLMLILKRAIADRKHLQRHLRIETWNTSPFSH